jgi:regulator of RNase E activity RraA
MWKSDEELLTLCRDELFTAVVGDVLDAAGRYHQFLPAAIQPLDPAMVVVGRAMPVLEADCFEQNVRAEGVVRPFGLMLEALDDLKQNEVYVCTGSSPTYALWGELMSTRARILGAAGAVVNGPSRDTDGILQLNFPTFSTGTYAQDQGPRGRVIDFRCEIGFDNGTRIRPGDLIFGDRDGVLAVPRELEAEIIPAAIEKVRGENKVRTAIENGMSSRDAFDKFGIM